MSTTKTKTLLPIPYLFFDGNCGDAIRFYESTFGGTITSMMFYRDLPSDAAPMDDSLRNAFGDRIMNVQLALPGGGLIYASDAHPRMEHHGVQSFSIALNFDSSDEAGDMFNKLADGGTITMPFAPTFWAQGFGMVTDKFGTEWMINGVLNSM